MGRRQKTDLPQAIYVLCAALIGDTARREYAIAHRTKEEEVLAEYARINEICERAFADVEPIVRQDILHDIRLKQGWERSRACAYIRKKEYYERKKSAILAVARELRLI